MPRYYIVEHAARGVYVGKKNGKPRMKWSILRTDKEAVKFWRREDAEAVAAAIRNSYVMEMTTLKKPAGRG